MKPRWPWCPFQMSEGQFVRSHQRMQLMPVSSGILAYYDVGFMNALKRMVFLILFWLVATPLAYADGGAHVVDSADTEDAGYCHLENMLTSYDKGLRTLTLAPACTPSSLPHIEFGGVVNYQWGEGAEVSLGPSLKLNLRDTARGLGIGLIADGEFGLHSGRVEALNLIIPFTVPINDKASVNFNSGWSYAYGHKYRDQLFIGAQVNITLAPDVVGMAEVFSYWHERPGGQFGLRWTPRGGHYDFDLLAGRYLDSDRRHAITIGFTARY